MHEASLALSIIRIAESAMTGRAGSRITRIEVSIGKLKAVEPELLVRSFAVLAKGTACEGAELVCREVPVTVRCRGCGAESEIARFRFLCSACGGTDLQILSGRELRIDRLTAAPRVAHTPHHIATPLTRGSQPHGITCS